MGALIKLTNELESTQFGVSLSTQGIPPEGSGQSATGFSWCPLLICIPHPPGLPSFTEHSQPHWRGGAGNKAAPSTGVTPWPWCVKDPMLLLVFTDSIPETWRVIQCSKRRSWQECQFKGLKLLETYHEHPPLSGSVGKFILGNQG